MQFYVTSFINYLLSSLTPGRDASSIHYPASSILYLESRIQFPESV